MYWSHAMAWKRVGLPLYLIQKELTTMSDSRPFIRLLVIKGWLGTRERSAVQVSPKTAISELFPDSDFLVPYILENREVQSIFAHVIT
jgi:hypothetical protein